MFFWGRSPEALALCLLPCPVACLEPPEEAVGFAAAVPEMLNTDHGSRFTGCDWIEKVESPGAGQASWSVCQANEANEAGVYGAVL